MAVATCTNFYCDAANGSNLYSGSTASGTPAYTHASGNWVNSTGVFTPTDGRTTSTYVTVGDFASVYPDAAAVTPFVGRVTAVGAGANGTITVSNTYKAGTKPADSTGGTTLVVGGCWKGPNGSSGFPFGFASHSLVNTSFRATRVNFKNNATYNITAAMTHAPASFGNLTFQGYTTTPGDGGKATIDGGTSGTAYTLLTATLYRGEICDFILTHNGATGSAYGLLIAGGTARRIVVHDVKSTGIWNQTVGALLIECEAYSCGAEGIYLATPGHAIRCIVHHNTTDGFGTYDGGQGYFYLSHCISFSNTRYGARFITRDSNGISYVRHCDFYNNGSTGLLLGNADSSTPAQVLVENCNLIKNGGYGIGSVYGTDLLHMILRNCGFGSGTQQNTSGQISSAYDTAEQSGMITYPANATPWVDPANGDFRINHASAKGAGFGTYTETASGYAGTVGYPDIGAAQHQDSGGNIIVPNRAQNIFL